MGFFKEFLMLSSLDFKKISIEHIDYVLFPPLMVAIGPPVTKIGMVDQTLEKKSLFSIFRWRAPTESQSASPAAGGTKTLGLSQIYTADP